MTAVMNSATIIYTLQFWKTKLSASNLFHRTVCQNHNNNCDSIKGCTLPGSPCARGILRKHFPSDKLCRIEFCIITEI